MCRKANVKHQIKEFSAQGGIKNSSRLTWQMGRICFLFSKNSLMGKWLRIMSSIFAKSETMLLLYFYPVMGSSVLKDNKCQWCLNTHHTSIESDGRGANSCIDRTKNKISLLEERSSCAFKHRAVQLLLKGGRFK